MQLNFSYLSKLRQYETGIFVLFKQCYYGEYKGTFHYFLRRMFQFPPPPILMIRVKSAPASIFCSFHSANLTEILINYARVDSREYSNVQPIVLITDGNSEIGAHIRSNLWYLIYVKGIWSDREQSQTGYFFLYKDLFSYMRA